MIQPKRKIVRGGRRRTSAMIQPNTGILPSQTQPLILASLQPTAANQQKEPLQNQQQQHHNHQQQHQHQQLPTAAATIATEPQSLPLSLPKVSNFISFFVLLCTYFFLFFFFFILFY